MGAGEGVSRPRTRRVVPLTGERLLSIRAVMAKVDLGESLILSMVKDGSFPQPKRVSERVVRWVGSDVDRWITDLPISKAS